MVTNTVCFYIFQTKGSVSGSINRVISRYTASTASAHNNGTDQGKSANPKEKIGNKPNNNPSEGHGINLHTAEVEFSDNTGTEPEMHLPVAAVGVPSNLGKEYGTSFHTAVENAFISNNVQYNIKSVSKF